MTRPTTTSCWGPCRGFPRRGGAPIFACAIACVHPDGRSFTVLGRCEGRIGFAPAGSGGFGYDPIFYRDGVSFGEMTPEEKDRVSHRGQALRAFAARFRQELEGER